MALRSSTLGGKSVRSIASAVFCLRGIVYRLLNAHDLITSPAYMVIKAANEFKYKTAAIHQLWRTDFTYLKITGWGW
jgi:RNA-directed DNA polymerase